MNRSRAWFDAVSDETGYRADTLEKVIRLGELAAELSRHPLLGTVLVLKGGTALNLCFGPPPRLSVDLDVNYVGAEDRDTMLEQRPLVEQAIEAVARAQKYRLQRSRAEHAGRKAYLGYTSTSGVADRIELDLNFLHRVPLDQAFAAQLWQPGDADQPDVMVVGMAELITGKLCAALDRAAPRDLYDVPRLPSIAGSAWQSPRLRSVFVALAGVLDHPVHSYSAERWRRVTDRAVEEQLHLNLTAGDRPSAAELREGAWAVVEPLIDLSPAEREYTDRLQAGDLRPDLLFPNDEGLAGRLARHPALLWKAENAKRHGSKKAES